MLNIIKNILNSLNKYIINYNKPKSHAFTSLSLQSRLSITKIFTNKPLAIHYKKQNFKIKNKLNESSTSEYKNIIYYPSSSKEWFDSVYSYNKSYVKPLITKNLILNNLFKSYFNMFNYKIKILFKRRRANKKHYSAKKLYISRPEIKHRNLNIEILLYTYDKLKSSIERNTLYFVRWPNNVKQVVIDTTYTTVKSRLDYLFRKYFKTVKWQSILFNINNKILNNTRFFLRKKMYIKSYNMHIHTRYFKRIYRLKRLFIKNTRSINFNTFKFNNLLLNLNDLGLNSLVQKMYNNKVKIKTIQLKSIHLNSDVFSLAVALKLKDRKKKAVRVLRKAILNMVKIPDLHTLITFDDFVDSVNRNNIINVIKQQVVSGIRFEAKGRLTRRLTAMRSIFKYRYTGSLKDIRSSYNNKPTTMLRGHVKPNLEYRIINSKTRNGSFGLKIWLSSH